MNKSSLVSLISSLGSVDLSDEQATENFLKKTEEVVNLLNCTLEDITLKLEYVTKFYFSNPQTPEWQYLLANFYALSLLGNMLGTSENKELLSVKDIKTVKLCISVLTKLGIYTKLQPKLPFKMNESYTNTEDIFYEYNILKCTIFAFCEFLKNVHLRPLVLTESFKGMLTGLYQIAHCPLKKSSEPLFTDEVYNRLLVEKHMAVALLNKLKDTIFPPIYIKETMAIFQQNSPMWFKKSVSQMLTTIIMSPNGVKNISLAMLDGTRNDKATTWKALDVIFRLISSCKKQLDFRENICKQVVGLLSETNDDTLVFERLFVVCTKQFYTEDQTLSIDIFVRKVVNNLLYFTIKDHKFSEIYLTEHIKKSIRLVHAIFIESTVESPSLPIEILKPVLGVVFRFYCLTSCTIFTTANKESKEILLKYLETYPEKDTTVFDSFLFGLDKPQEILPFRKDISLDVKGDNIVLSYLDHSAVISVSDSSEAVLKLFENNSKLLSRFFSYLLRCLGDRDKYFKKVDEQLLTLESEIMTEYFERNLVVYKLLSNLAEDKIIQKELVDSPEELILFIKNIFSKTIQVNMHKTSEYECDGFQTVFTLIMILNALTDNSKKGSLNKFESLVEPLQTIKNGTKHKELIDLIDKILHKIIVSDKASTKIHIEETKSKLDIVLEDICDPLLPVRGHGIMALRKLVEEKDSSVLEKKQYVLTIFQQNLKNEDSFIYLSAIDGLAAMADVFTDTVLSTLCEEYSDFTRNDDKKNEIRMKLGEVLVRVTKTLGEMAPKYKSLLLNTFLNGTKDEDHLVRASSLSNLGEICRVLSYKLGTIVTEVLVCVHAIIATDKAVEARRAAVTVVRQLLAGLESEMIAFLKEDILPIYRTLKEIYNSDKDDVMRLQAQLALEELNENMKNFVFAKPQLNTDKKIIMLS